MRGSRQRGGSGANKPPHDAAAAARTPCSQPHIVEVQDCQPLLLRAGTIAAGRRAVEDEAVQAGTPSRRRRRPAARAAAALQGSRGRGQGSQLRSLYNAGGQTSGPPARASRARAARPGLTAKASPVVPLSPWARLERINVRCKADRRPIPRAVATQKFGDRDGTREAATAPTGSWMDQLNAQFVAIAS